jgi:flagellar biosynthesis protein FlhG
MLLHQSEAMNTAVETIERPQPIARNRKIISVASGKGGVGKTWCSISLSQALAEAGQRVLLFDGDLGLANVDIQLGLMPKQDLSDVLSGTLTMRQARVSYLEGGFDIIAGRSGAGSLASLPASVLSQIRGDLNDISSDYDRIIVDLGAGIERTVRALTLQAGLSVVVITPEPTSLTDSYAYIKVVTSKPPVPDLRIIVNMAETREEGEKAYKTLLKACQSFLKLSPPLAGIIRRDKKVSEAIRQQQPILSYSPRSEAAQDLRAIAAVLV